jgi:cytochrome c-type biogenesis protein CcmE
MKAKHQRLTLALLALAALIGAGLLAASALKDQAAYFYSPADLQRNAVAPDRLVLDHSAQADALARRGRRFASAASRPICSRRIAAWWLKDR